MNAVDILKNNTAMCRKFAVDLITDMKDSAMTQPTKNGGNHPLWVLGHLAYSEGSMIQGMMLGKDNPLADWKDLFEGGSEPTTDASKYPSFDEIMKKSDEVHALTMQYLEGITEADLEKPSAACPDEYKEWFGTVGKCLNINALHPFMHYGQVADARRAAGRKPLMM
ncbi:MAG: DinB family protein [Phycisphaeraceae bacterium]|nr:DinB family protein [Phycisphaerales bacterium]MCB9859617.1 DinB family protein [Phycisphaeraceae bacterium]